MFGIGDTLKQAWYGLWVLIDSLVYSLISIAYQVFNLIAKASLYNSENGDIKVMVERISVILGIGMLFIIAYNIILNIMNPDKASSSGDKSMQGIFKNAIIAIVMLTAYSTVFTYMTRIQNHIIDSQVIEKIILGADETNNTSSSDMGATVAAKIFTTFFYPIDDNGNVVTYEDCENSSLDVCQAYREGVEAAESGSIITFITNSTLFDSLVKKKPHMKYLYLISTICGIVALLMFVSYVIDIGIRVAKMAFLQIIAPIPIMAYITKPSGGIFSKWLNDLIKTYLSLFMRLITIYFAMFLINILASNMGNNTGGVFGDTSNVSVIIKLFGYLVLILGVLLFAKDAPKLLENLLGTTFGEGGGFSPKAIAKKLSGVRDVPGVGGAIGKGLDKANQGIGAAAGWYGARQAAIKNNRRLEKLQRQGKDTGGLTHMDVNAAGLQGRHNGYKKGGIGQAKSQGENVFQQTYGYGKKQGHNGGFSRATLADEKYGKMYEKNVKDYAKARNDEIRNKAIGHEIPGKDDAASVRMKAGEYMAKNAEFAANSQTYKDVAAEVDREAATKGITLSPEERKAKINEKLSQISATTTNANEKRLIDSYLSRESVIADYQSSVLAGNKDAIAKVKVEADTKTKALVKAEIDSKGLQAAISDPSVRLQLEGNAKVQANGIMASVKGDISKLNIDSSSMEKINATAVANVDAQITAAGGVGNITLTADQQANVNSAIKKQVTETIAKAGGTEKIVLDAANQATFAATEQTMKASATSEVESRLSAEFTQADEAKIRNEIYSKSTVDEGGIIRNLSPQELKAKADQAVADAKADKRQQIAGEVFDKLNESIAKVRDNLVQKQVANACNKDEITRTVLIQEQQTEGARQFVYDQQLRAGVEEQLYRDNYDNVERKVMIEANEAAANKIIEGVLKYEDGRITGEHTNDKDGKIDKVYNAEYAQNEKISNDGVKTKSAEDLAWDKIKKAVLDKDKK